MKYFIGWDVGIWKCENTHKSSCDAILLLNEDDAIGHYRDNLSQIIQDVCDAPIEHKRRKLIDTWFSLCGHQETYSDDNAYYIAIDTPLGWPRAFNCLLNGSLDLQWQYHHTSRNVDNRMLFRRTERELGSSLSAVVDSIGSQSTKGIALLCAVAATPESWGIWKSQNLTLIETYPKACIRSEAFVDWAAQQNLPHDIREWYNYKNRKADRRIQEQDDTFDAGILHLLAKVFVEKGQSLRQPPTNDPEGECNQGWIFYPSGALLPKTSLAKYGSVVNADDVTTLGEAIHRLQQFVRKQEAADVETIDGETEEVNDEPK